MDNNQKHALSHTFTHPSSDTMVALPLKQLWNKHVDWHTQMNTNKISCLFLRVFLKPIRIFDFDRRLYYWLVCIVVIIMWSCSQNRNINIMNMQPCMNKWGFFYGWYIGDIRKIVFSIFAWNSTTLYRTFNNIHMRKKISLQTFCVWSVQALCCICVLLYLYNQLFCLVWSEYKT